MTLDNKFCIHGCAVFREVRAECKIIQVYVKIIKSDWNVGKLKYEGSSESNCKSVDVTDTQVFFSNLPNSVTCGKKITHCL